MAMASANTTESESRTPRRLREPGRTTRGGREAGKVLVGVVLGGQPRTVVAPEYGLILGVVTPKVEQRLSERAVCTSARARRASRRWSVAVLALAARCSGELQEPGSKRRGRWSEDRGVVFHGARWIGAGDVHAGCRFHTCARTTHARREGGPIRRGDERLGLTLGLED